MPQINLPYVVPQYIIDGEKINAPVTNRPLIQIQENVLKLRDRVELNWGNINALLGNPEIYDKNKVYSKGDIVKDPNSDTLYKSLKDNNKGHELSDTNWWKVWNGVGGSLKLSETDPTSSDTGYNPGTHWLNTKELRLYVQRSNDPENPLWFKVNIEKFIEIEDTPSSYSGHAGKLVIVNDTEDGLIFIDTLDAGTFTGK